MTSKRSSKISQFTSTKTPRLTPSNPFGYPTIPYLTPLDIDEPEQLNVSDEISTPLLPLTIPDFFEDQEGGGNAIEFDQSEPHSAFHNTLQEFDIMPKTQTKDLVKFLKSLARQLDQKLPPIVQENIGVKAWLVVKVNYCKIDDESKIVEAFHKSQPFIFVNDFQVQDQIRKMLEQILTESAHFMREASGHVYHCVVGATVQIAQHQPLVGKHFVDLPQHLLKKNAIVNVKNNDNRCFGYAVLSALHPSQSDNPNRPKQYEKYFEMHNMHSIEYPVSENQIPTLEDILHVKINLFTFSHEGHRKYPLYTSAKKYPFEIDLLYWDRHYAWIKNFAINSPRVSGSDE